jgi:hypothetical protein
MHGESRCSREMKKGGCHAERSGVSAVSYLSKQILRFAEDDNAEGFSSP